jgi:spore maturation protein CgeB
MTEHYSLNGQRILIVGNPSITHIGAHLNQAANNLGLDVRFCDTREAFDGPVWLSKLNWWVRGHRPSALRKFSEQVVRVCKECEPAWVLSTGLAPIDKGALAEIGSLGIQRLNYLTDDPWNSAHRSSWFMRSLPLYDHVFSPRRAILDDVRRLGCSQVSYLPFAYAPEIHFPEPAEDADTPSQFESDVAFAGAADTDRVPYIDALIQANFKLGLYGGFWERFPETKAYARGIADASMLRKVIGGAKVALCLVRRANRDGNSMRTFEVPAVGACMLTEDTEEHREIFGEDGKAAVYFRTIDEMIEKLRWLLAHDADRLRLAKAAHDLIVTGSNTYRDRLRTILGAHVKPAASES